MELNEYIACRLVHEIHTSGRRSFKACRRSWNWTFNEQYYPTTTAKPLEFGSSYHRGMEVYYDPKTWDWDEEIKASRAILAFEEMCIAQKQKALADYGTLDPEVEKDYAERVELGKGMLRYYFSEVAPNEDIGWKPVKVEIGFMVPIPNPETGEEAIWCKCDQCWGRWVTKIPHWHAGMPMTPCNDVIDSEGNILGTYEQIDRSEFPGLPVVYAGRLDMLAMDALGNYYIFDWKTAARLTENSEFLQLDDQIASYCWALYTLGIKVRGFIYHEQRKAYPIPPKQNKQRRLGALYSVSKQEPYEYELYLATVQAGDPEGYANGAYDDFLYYLQYEGVKYFNRFPIIKTEQELAIIETNIGLEALDMIDPGLRLYPSPGTFKCNWCAFQQPCVEMNSGGDYQFALDTMYEQREAYYVRNEPSTEKADR